MGCITDLTLWPHIPAGVMVQKTRWVHGHYVVTTFGIVSHPIFLVEKDCEDDLKSSKNPA